MTALESATLGQVDAGSEKTVRLADILKQAAKAREVMHRREEQIARGEPAEKKECCNTSVGCIITNPAGDKLILVENSYGDYKYGLPAGHGLDKNLRFEETVREEVEEEVGITGKKEEDFAPQSGATAAYEDPCNRNNGKLHYWKVYSLKADEGEGSYVGDEGVKGMKWTSMDELKQLVENTRAWDAAGRPADGFPEKIETLWIVHMKKAGFLEGVDVDFALNEWKPKELKVDTSA